MVPCRFSSRHTLSLFIRSIAQIEYSCSASLVAAGTLQENTNRRSSTTRPFSLHPSPSPCREYSALAYNNAAQRDPDTSTPSCVPDKKYAATSSILELTTDAIDALAAETKSNYSHEDYNRADNAYETPLETLMKDAPRRKAWPPADEAEQCSRTGEPEDTGFSLRFTSQKPFAKERKQIATGKALNHLQRRPLLNVQPVDPANAVKPGKQVSDWVPPPREDWMIQKEALKKKFPEGYMPLKRLSPDAIAGIRALNAQMPERYTTWVLSQEFEVSPEAIRRILKSKWRPDADEESDRARRWQKRGESIWGRYAELGVKPPKKWRDEGIGKGKPDWKAQRNTKFKYEPPPLPALVTTSRQKEQKTLDEVEMDLDDVADRIL